jgi:hypothetical protein
MNTIQSRPAPRAVGARQMTPQSRYRGQRTGASKPAPTSPYPIAVASERRSAVGVEVGDDEHRGEHRSDVIVGGEVVE